jgi:hypothetical protein
MVVADLSSATLVTIQVSRRHPNMVICAGISDETSGLVQVTGALAAGRARISHRGRPALRLAT